MRFLMVVPQAFYTTRGTPMSAYHRTRELIERGHSVDILTYPVGDPPPSLDIQIFRSKGPHFYSEIKSGPTKRKIWFDFLLSLNLFFLLLRKKYDAIYTHEEAAFIVRMAPWFLRKPYVYDMHSSLPKQIRDWKFSDRQWVTDLFGWVERQSVKHATAVVAISPAVADAALESWAHADPIIIVNHFEQEPSKESISGQDVREKYGIHESEKLVVYTGSFVPLQALDLLIESVKTVADAVSQVRYLIVGGKPDELSEYSALVEKFGVSDRIVLVESRPQHEMSGFLEAADVLVSPRVQGINPPGKLFSYLASGKPVVATDCLVHNQLLDRTCAMLSEPDADSFAEATKEVLLDPVLSSKLTQGAESFLETHCGDEVRNNAYDRMISKLSSATKEG